MPTCGNKQHILGAGNSRVALHGKLSIARDYHCIFLGNFGASDLLLGKVFVSFNFIVQCQGWGGLCLWNFLRIRKKTFIDLTVFQCSSSHYLFLQFLHCLQATCLFRLHRSIIATLTVLNWGPFLTQQVFFDSNLGRKQRGSCEALSPPVPD